MHSPYLVLGEGVHKVLDGRDARGSPDLAEALLVRAHLVAVRLQRAAITLQGASTFGQGGFQPRFLLNADVTRAAVPQRVISGQHVLINAPALTTIATGVQAQWFTLQRCKTQSTTTKGTGAGAAIATVTAKAPTTA